ncbi:MAG: PadR family transcriptional regulator [Planctomycetota bacterium]
MDETPSQAEIVPGTLDAMVLSVLAEAPTHGYGVARAIRSRSGDAILVEEGTLYPALRRLEKNGLIRGDWRKSESNRRARYYELTEAGKRRLAADIDRWSRSSSAVNAVLGLTWAQFGGAS